MNSFSLSISYLKHKLLRTALTVITFASGIAVIVALLLINSQLNNEFTKNLKNIDLVVGAKGSPMQLILSSVFHLDAPTGNIPLEEAEKLEKHPLVKSAIPVALGDNYNGFRIVGTNESYINNYEGRLKEGRVFKDKMEVVIGSEVAKKFNNKIGDKIVGAHGLVNSDDLHTDFPYIIVGIFQPTNTVLDRLVLTSVESVWHVHEHAKHDEHEDEGHQDKKHDKGHKHEHKAKHDNHHDDEHEKHEEKEITALLITYKTPMALATLPRVVNKSSSMQSASPAFEVARLTSFMGVGSSTLKTFGWYLIILSGFGIFVALYNAMSERKYDLALMRSFGASKKKLFNLIIIEGVIISLLGVLIGLALGHGLVDLASIWLAQTKHISITGKVFLNDEIWLIIASLIVGVVASILPAIKVYKIDIFKTLVKR
ncbi:MAG: ABC transporter permease [Alphaproteobacteria bacterium]